MKSIKRVARMAVAACATAALAACSDSTGVQPRIPTELKTDATATLVGTPGYAVPQPVAVRLVDRNGQGVPGYTIDFSVQSGDGAITPGSVTTDSAGYARVQWVLGNSAGEQSLRAAVHDMSITPVTIKATAQFGREASLVAISPTNFGTAVGACQTSQGVTVRVVDHLGAPVANAAVDFTASDGGVATPATALSDASGMARTAWAPGPNGGNQTIKATLRIQNADANAVTTTANVLPRAWNGFAAIDSTLIGPNCQPYKIYGIARPSLEWEPFGSPHFDQVNVDFANIKSWGANTVRIPVNQTYWLQASSHYVPGYRDFVIQTVAKARAAGLNVIFDLHIGDRGQQNFDPSQGMPQMPDVNHSLPFWKDVANIYKGDGGVIFELYNEPHDVTPEVWRNGGTIPAGPNYDGGPIGEAYQAVGMQQLYDAVRAQGAQNLVIIGGTHWGYYLSTVKNNLLTGYNIAYSAHPYDYADKQPNVWDTDFGFMAAKAPMIVTEFGAYDCNADGYYTKFLDYAAQKKISWIAWAWWTPPDVSATYTASQRSAEVCNFPSLILDWNGTPSATGSLIKSRLSATAH